MFVAPEHVANASVQMAWPSRAARRRRFRRRPVAVSHWAARSLDAETAAASRRTVEENYLREACVDSAWQHDLISRQS